MTVIDLTGIENPGCASQHFLWTKAGLVRSPRWVGCETENLCFVSLCIWFMLFLSARSVCGALIFPQQPGKFQVLSLKKESLDDGRVYKPRL